MPGPSMSSLAPWSIVAIISCSSIPVAAVSTYRSHAIGYVRAWGGGEGGGGGGRGRILELR